MMPKLLPKRQRLRGNDHRWEILDGGETVQTTENRVETAIDRISVSAGPVRTKQLRGNFKRPEC
jgi:CRISPR/Cas system CSM-associated protein Csm3 (group 7 of RAMP superfamily)